MSCRLILIKKRVAERADLPLVPGSIFVMTQRNAARLKYMRAALALAPGRLLAKS